MNNNNIKIAKNIKLIREFLKLTQPEFAEKVGSNKNKMTMYETARAKPNYYCLLQIHKLCGIPIDKLENEELSIEDLQAFSDKNILLYQTHSLWVSAKDKLPLKRQRVLISIMTFTYKTATFLPLYINEFQEFQNVFISDDKTIYTVENNIFWMHLPKPPQQAQL